MSIVIPTDFTGRFDLTTKGYLSLEVFIDQYEPIILKKLLGIELYNLYVADTVLSVPQTDIYLDIYQESELVVCEIKRNYEGLKDLLIPFIYYEYLKAQRNRNSSSGGVQNQSSLSVASMQTYAQAVIYINEAISQARILQFYLEENIDIYPTFRANLFQFMSVV